MFRMATKMPSLAGIFNFYRRNGILEDVSQCYGKRRHHFTAAGIMLKCGSARADNISCHRHYLAGIHCRAANKMLSGVFPSGK